MGVRIVIAARTAPMQPWIADLRDGSEKPKIALAPPGVR